MLRRIFAIVLIVLGLATAGAAIGSGTIWRPADVVTATLPQDPDVPVVVAGGNVLATVNPNVTVTLTAPDSEAPIVLAMGRESDVRAWLDESPYLEVTGLTDWETLAVADGPAATEDAGATEDATEDPSASEDASATADASEDASGDEQAEEDPADATVPDPAGSDLWIEEATGTGELTYDWSQVEGRWMMLVATDGTQPAPNVSMTWTREVTTPLVVPGLIVGGVLFLIGLVWLIVELLVHREERRARRARWAEAAGEEAPAVPTTAEDGTPLTRRQIREASRAADRKGSTETAVAAPPTADSAEEAVTPQAGISGTEQPDEAPGDWTAIITGAPASDDSAENAAEKADAADTDESNGSDDASASGASDLDEWVRSGRTGDDAGPVSTYESPAPGRSVDADPAGAISPAWQGTPGSDDGAEAPTDADAGPGDGDPVEGHEKPRRWWQRRKRNDAAGAPAAPQDDLPARAAENGTDPGQARDAVDEPNPQASGASWRQTWGLTVAVDTGEEPAGAPAPPAEETDGPAEDSGRTDEESGRTDEESAAGQDPVEEPGAGIETTREEEDR